MSGDEYETSAGEVAPGAFRAVTRGSWDALYEGNVRFSVVQCQLEKTARLLPLDSFKNLFASLLL